MRDLMGAREIPEAAAPSISMVDLLEELVGEAWAAEREVGG